MEKLTGSYGQYYTRWHRNPDKSRSMIQPLAFPSELKWNMHFQSEDTTTVVPSRNMNNCWELMLITQILWKTSSDYLDRLNPQMDLKIITSRRQKGILINVPTALILYYFQNLHTQVDSFYRLNYCRLTTMLPAIRGHISSVNVGSSQKVLVLLRLEGLLLP